MTDFSRSNPRDQRVPVLLSSDEYLLARDEAERHGLSISSYFRHLLLADRRSVGVSELSLASTDKVSAEPAQELHTIVSLAVTAAIDAYEKGKQL